MQKNITPLPWVGKVQEGALHGRIYSKGVKGSGWVAVFKNDIKPQDLAFIVKACNSHDELVAALKVARFALVDVESEYRPCGQIENTIQAAFSIISNAIDKLEAE